MKDLDLRKDKIENRKLRGRYMDELGRLIEAKNASIEKDDYSNEVALSARIANTKQAIRLLDTMCNLSSPKEEGTLEITIL